MSSPLDILILATSKSRPWVRKDVGIFGVSTTCLELCWPCVYFISFNIENNTWNVDKTLSFFYFIDDETQAQRGNDTYST